jgi:heterotetrameric sarcosine oxidase delta subunit
MLEITCPFCGPRNEVEFVHGGPEKKRRPDSSSDMDDQQWVQYLTVSPNPLGPVAERWWHVRGCGGWFTIHRDTRTHDIVDEITDSEVAG